MALSIASPQAVYGDDHDLLKRIEKLEKLVEKLVSSQTQVHGTSGQADIELIHETQRLIAEQKEELQSQNTRVTKLEESKIGDNIRDIKLSDGFNIGDTNFKIGGYIKGDVFLSKFSDGDLASGSSGRDFLVPAAIPVSATGDDNGADIDFSARETRLLFKSDTPTDFGKIGGHLELDFLITGGGNEVVSNSYSPRLRQAFVTFNGWTVGQAWSTFQDVKVWQDHLDFLGAIPGMVLNRQALVRYQSGGFEFAAETPETVLNDVGGNRIVSGDGAVPDFVVRYTHTGDWGHVRAAAILRNLQAEAGLGTLTSDDTTLGYGFNVSGKIKAGGRDNFSFKLNAGEGIGRYLALSLISDAIVTTDGDLEAIGIISGFASYQHFWSSKWRSNVTFGFLDASYPDEFRIATVSDSSMSVHANLLYSPVPKLTVGLEYIYGDRGVIGGDSGDLNRLQFSAKLGW